MTAEAREAIILRAGAPLVAGLSARGFRGESDFPVMADIMQKSRDADLYDIVETADDVSNEFEHLQNFDPQDDLLFLEVKGETIGFCRCQWHDVYGNVRAYGHSVHLAPEWRKGELRKAMLISNEMRLAEVAAQHETDRSRFLEARAVAKPNDWRSLLESQGYLPHNHTFLMTRSLREKGPDVPLPEGYAVREVEKEHTREIWKACEEAMREEPSFNEELWTEEGYRWVSGHRIFRPELWRIAWNGDKIAGGVLNFIDGDENKRYGRDWGYTQGIFVGKEHRGKGLASALIARSFDVLRAQEMSDAALTVDTENPSGALRLYEKMGFRTAAEYTTYRKPL